VGRLGFNSGLSFGKLLTAFSGLHTTGVFSPLSLSPLQWLYSFLSPSTAVDKNGLDGDYVESPCLTLDGSGDKVNVGALSGKPTSNFTIMVWAKPAAVSEQAWIIEAGNTDCYIRHSGTTLLFRHNGIGDGTTQKSGFFTDTNWHHISCVWDGAKTYIYKDAVLSTSENSTGTLGSAAFTKFILGVSASAPSGRYWAGSMAGVRAIPQALTPTEIASCMDGDCSFASSIHLPLTEKSGDKAYDISDNGNDGTIATADLDAVWSGTQDVSHPFAGEGGSKVLLDVDDTSIAVTDLLTTHAVTSTGTATVDNAVDGVITVVDGYVATISIDGVLTYDLKNFYGSTLPSSSAWATGVLTGGAEHYLPALASGLTDVAGNPITNPAGILHNNGPHSIKQKAENDEFLLTPFWSADEANYDAKSFEDFADHANFTNNVVLKCEDGFFIDALTWSIAYEWTLTSYDKMIRWIGDVCYTNSLEFGDL